MNEGVSGWWLGPFIFLLADVELSADSLLLTRLGHIVKRIRLNLVKKCGNMNIGIFSTRFRQIREFLGLKQTEFAQKLGIPRTSSINYEKGTSIPSEVLNSLADKFNVNIEWFLTGEGDMFRSQKPEKTEYSGQISLTTGRMPVYSQADLENNEKAFVIPLLNQKLSAGNGQELPQNDEATALIPVPSHLAKFGKNIAALTVEGDSMYPTLERGDVVVCDSCGWSGEGIYALRMGGDGFVKRLTKAPGKLVIISDNPKYPPREEPEESQDYEIIGRVHCAIKNME